MLFDVINAIRTGSSYELKIAIASLLLSLPIIILSLSVHEVSHGYVANKLGDPTAKNFGRLSLNPLKHLDPIGFIMMIAFGFGFAKPVPVESRNFKKPRRDMALTAFAGPVSNLILAFIFGILLKIFYLLPIQANSELTFYIYLFTVIILQMGMQLNVGLAIFNLLPCPPLDGSKILYLFLPMKWYYKVLQYERYIYFALMIIVFTGLIDPVLYFLIEKVMWLISTILFL